MMTPLRLASLLLFSSALVAPALVRAQDAPDTSTTDAGAPAAGVPGDAVQAAEGPADTQDFPADEEEVGPDISVPGGEIVVGGRAGTNVVRNSSPVTSVL